MKMKISAMLEWKEVVYRLCEWKLLVHSFIWDTLIEWKLKETTMRSSREKHLWTRTLSGNFVWLFIGKGNIDYLYIICICSGAWARALTGNQIYGHVSQTTGLSKVSLQRKWGVFWHRTFAKDLIYLGTSCIFIPYNNAMQWILLPSPCLNYKESEIQRSSVIFIHSA